MSMRKTLLSGAVATLLALVPLVPAAASSGLFGDFKPKQAGDITVRGGMLIVVPQPSGKVQTQGGVDTGSVLTRLTPAWCRNWI